MEGNQMKMREALELAITIGDWCCANTDDPLECCVFSCVYQVEPHGEAGADCPWKKIRAALAAPPRNCDVGTAEDWERRFMEFCKSHSFDCPKCPLNTMDNASCLALYLQMPYGKERLNDAK